VMSRASQSQGLRLLHVICTPRGLGSNTGRVTSCLLEELREQDEDLDVRTLDLFRTDLPSVAGQNIESKYRLMTGQDLDDDAHSSWSEIERTIEQFLDADLYVLTVPMWNLGIPYALKYYIDAIVQPGYLFRYLADGRVEGLVKDRKMIVVTSSGGDYAPEHMRPYDFVESYLRAIFGFVGITDIRFIRAGGMDVSPQVRKAGQKAAIADVREYCRSGEWRPARRAVALPGRVAATTAPTLVA
jgi:FMN-dependent NADH-azoreductase